MKIVNSKFKIIPGFTIIELLIVIFIFSTVMIMASSSFATSYISGRTHSSGSMEANRSLSLVLDLIGQKMANASYFYILGDNSKVYGFRASDDAHLLTIAINGVNCANFHLNGTAIEMLQNGCWANPIPTSGWEKISSPDIKITQFDLSQRNQWDPVAKTAPYITVKITGEDTKTGGKATLESTYSIPAYTYNKW